MDKSTGGIILFFIFFWCLLPMLSLHHQIKEIRSSIRDIENKLEEIQQGVNEISSETTNNFNPEEW